MDRLLASIKELLFETVSNQEQLILVYLEKNIDDLTNQSLAKVADNNFCSTTSVTRLIKKLGYNSYKEMQLSLKLTKEAESINEMTLNPEFIQCLQQSKCIYIYGKGASHITSLYLFRKLIKLGYDASLIDEQDLLYSLTNKTVVCISNSGETSTVYKVMADIKEFNQCQILSITSKDSTLDQISNYSLTHNNLVYGNRDEQHHLMTIVSNLCNQL